MPSLIDNDQLHLATVAHEHVLLDLINQLKEDNLFKVFWTFQSGKFKYSERIFEVDICSYQQKYSLYWPRTRERIELMVIRLMSLSIFQQWISNHINGGQLHVYNDKISYMLFVETLQMNSDLL